MREIRRLAIVDRGESALRAVTAVSELNAAGGQPPVTSVAFHAESDARAWYVREADEVVPLRPPAAGPDGRPGRPPFDGPALMEALRAARVDAVWPGRDMVTDLAGFGLLCERAGLLHIGPDGALIRMLAEPNALARIARLAGVPLADPAARVAVAETAPPAPGAIPAETALGTAAETAATPAAVADEPRAATRRIMVEVVADAYGGIWTLGVRDHSVRYGDRVVFEESSSPALTADTERAARHAAVRVAAAAGFRTVGTVEFLLYPDDGRLELVVLDPRPPLGVSVTELTTGVDLTRLQLHLARDGRLDGGPPPPRGHAVAVRLRAEDPENGFAPAPGRLAVLALPTGAGVRVDTGLREGDPLDGDWDSRPGGDGEGGGDGAIASITAWGRDRDEALARLRRAVDQTTVVVAGGTTNRSLLLDLLHRPALRHGRYDDRWLERLTAAGDHRPAPDPVAVLVAAVAAYEEDQAAEQVTFHAQAARGGPDLPATAGHACRLRYHGISYPLRVFRTGARTYRVHSSTALADVAVDDVGPYRRRVVVGGRHHRVVTVAEGAVLRVEIDGVAHTITRDDGDPVRAGWPALVVSVLVSAGDTVAHGDPLLVMESMKMQTTVTAPCGGEITAVAVTPNTQVEAETPLLHIRHDTPLAEHVGPAEHPSPAEHAGPAVAARNGAGTVRQATAAVRFTGLTTAPPSLPACTRVYGALRGYLLGYDLDAVTVRRMILRQRRLGELALAADPGLLACEDDLLDLFADAGSLYRPRTAAEGPTTAGTAPGEDSPQEYLLSYLQWLDADRAGLPAAYRERLAAALARYGVSSLDRTPELEEAVVWLFRSFRRVDEFVPIVANILERRLRHREVLSTVSNGRLRARLDHLAAATEGRHQAVADLARDVRYRFLDEPLLTDQVEREWARMAAHLDALRDGPEPPERAHHIERLVACPQPLRGLLLERWARGDRARGGRARDRATAERRLLLEVHTRRFYRIRDLRDLNVHEHDGRLLCGADFDVAGRRMHLVTAYANLADLPKVAQAVAEHLAEVDPHRAVVVDLTARAHGEPAGVTALATEVSDLLTCCDFGRAPHRLDVTVTSAAGTGAEHVRTCHLTFRAAPGGGFVEEELYRNLHPMLAKRLDLWRLSNFRLERLRSAEDVYLFHGVAHDNPADRRLFALAEVRDLTPVRDANGVVSYPRLELMGLSALAAIRSALTGFAPRERPDTNRVVLFVSPLWTVPRELWPELFRPLAAMARGAGLERVLLRVRVPGPGGTPRESVLHVDVRERSGVSVRERAPGDRPVRPLTPYRQKVLRARRFGAPYPYELLSMLAPPPGAVSRFPPGRFTEYDLVDGGSRDDGDGSGRASGAGDGLESGAGGGLVPVERPPGENTANIVVGLLTNTTVKVPEGMTRVVLLGDPTRGLGNLAEPECRRIIAALDLAERLRLPVEWFALSSGARIAMDSGTENMDWIAAVLRRLIEFTQAGGEVNIVVTGINVGAQPYWNAEATMLMHTRGILVMTPDSAMVLTGKQALGFSGGVSAEDNFGIGGFDRIMGPNGQSQHWAATVPDACEVLLRHYDHTYVVPGERHPRRAVTADPIDRDVCAAPHSPVPGSDLAVVGDIFSAERNPGRKKPFDIRSVLRAVTDTDAEPLERWHAWRGAENAVVWDAHLGGYPVCLLGVESHNVPRRGFVPVGGPPAWTSGTLFPQASRKIARAVNAASGNRPVVMLANLSGFDGSPESMRHWQLEYGAEIGRAVTNFRGPIVFVVVSRYHGGAFVVFSKTLNEGIEMAAVDGSYASVIGGAPAAATVFAREVAGRTERDRRVLRLRERLAAGGGDTAGLRAELATTLDTVRAEQLGAVAREFDGVHTVRRAMAVGSVDRIIPAAGLRPYLVDAIERGLAQPPSDAPAPGGRAVR